MLSNPTRYGLIACRYLVWGWHNNVWLNAPEIAARYSINVRALSPALRRLVMAGILRSQCGGTRPGFMLSRAPEEVTMLEVYARWKATSAWTAVARFSPASSAHARRTIAGSAECSGEYWTSCVTGFRICRSKTTPPRKKFRGGVKPCKPIR